MVLNGEARVDFRSSETELGWGGYVADYKHLTPNGVKSAVLTMNVQVASQRYQDLASSSAELPHGMGYFAVARSALKS